MPRNSNPIRIVQWTSGKVASESVKAILSRPNLELVGLYAYSRDKLGQDAGDLVGLGRQIGVKATDDIDALLALKPDCVVYMPLYPDVEHMAKLLRAGVNIVTTASFMTGRGYGPKARATLQDAAIAGGASLFGSGINPGWIDSLIATASSACREVNLIRVTESFNIGAWAGEANQDALGWGRPAGDPGHAADVEQATMPFGDAVEATAHMFGFELDAIRCAVEFAHATEDLDVPGRDVKKGTVAGILSRWRGFCGGVPVIELNAQWTLADEITPTWEIAMAYRVQIIGTPQITLQANVLPEDMDVPMEELVATGHIITALPVVNAIPAVVAAKPGIVGYADLPPVTSALRPKPGAGDDYKVPLAEHAPTHRSTGTRSTADRDLFEGTWRLTIKAPTGGAETVLVVENKGGVYGGTQSGDGASSPMLEVKVEGHNVSWVNLVTKPMKLKCVFTGVIDGPHMTGKVKAGFMGSYKFTAIRVDG